MVPTFLRINAVTRAKREEVITLVRDALTGSGAWILDVKQFSNQSICFSFEMPARSAALLRDAFIANGLHLTKESEESFASLLEAHDPEQEISREADIAGTLQITFIHNEPDLRIEVPQIPG